MEAGALCSLQYMEKDKLSPNNLLATNPDLSGFIWVVTDFGC